MEPLIRFRLLSAELNKKEADKFIKKIMNSFGREQIISCIFHDFMHEYKEKHVHNGRLQMMIEMASNIINSRKKEKNALVEESVLSQTERVTIKFDALPYEVIGECASYLKQEDYLNLSITNRAIYCGTNSPNRLKELDCSCWSVYSDFDLNRFKQLKCLRVCTSDFNEFASSSYPMQNTFSHLVEFDIYYEGYHADMDVLLHSTYIPFGQITQLTLENFGKQEQLYDFDSFCMLLSRFPNVSHLELQEIHLTEFNEENEHFASMLPKLKALDCENLGDNDSSNQLRNKLMSARSKELRELRYDGRVDTYSFNKLKVLIAAKADSSELKRILDSSKQLENVNLGERNDCEEDREIIVSLFTAFPKVKEICMSADEEKLQSIASFIEIGLMESRSMERKSLTIALGIADIDDEPKHITMKDIELATNRIVNALHVTKTQNWRFECLFPHKIDKDNDRRRICQSLKQLYLTANRQEPDENDDVAIIVSNKDCNICKYAWSF